LFAATFPINLYRVLLALSKQQALTFTKKKTQ
jgi:hypothetical protein